MANTKKGKNTQDTILNTAKHLFYIHGFEKVSLSDVCVKAEKNLGTLTYYFPKKWHIIDALYQQYMARLQSFVAENAEGVSEAEKYAYVILMYYYNVYTDSAVTRFHHAVMSESSMNDIFNDTKQIILPLLGEEIDEDLLDLYVKADNAVRRELNLAFMRGKARDLDSIVNLVRRIHMVAIRLYGFDLATLDEYLSRGEQFLLTHPNAIKLIEK